MKRLLFVLVGMLALAAPASALADAPPNDNRAAAEQLPSFPVTLHGTTIGATPERLDPQTGACGAAESTVWYRIDQAPDGLIRVAVHGPGLAAAVRVFRVGRSAISEVRCANGKANATATVAFESVRGASFLVMVGKRPGTADAAFDLDASLFLPPANDHAGGAARIRTSGRVSGSTVGATSDDADPHACGLAGQSVWYALRPAHKGRIAIKLQAGAGIDTSLVVLEQVRSRMEIRGCARTGRSGRAVTTLDVDRGRYFVAVGQQEGSPPGPFAFEVIAAQAREVVATRTLPARGVHDSVHGLADVNDLYRLELHAGETYRIAFTSGEPCATLSLYRRGGRAAEGFGDVTCSGYRTFTPGPDGGGSYVLAVDAAPDATTQPYRLQVAAAGSDDLGVGIPIANHTTRRGSLQPGGVDIVDVYHFDVAIVSDVRVSLRAASPSFALQLLRDTGERVSSGAADIRRRLGPGRYVVAVSAPPGTSGGTYALALLIRDLTQTVLTADGKPASSVAVGATVALRAATTPAATGVEELQIDRFDPLTGWHFFRLLRVPASSGSVTWAPPAAGRWRVRASYRGSVTSSPSRSGYVLVVVGGA